MNTFSRLRFALLNIIFTLFVNVINGQIDEGVFPLPDYISDVALGPPICTSQNTLCRISFNISAAEHTMTTNSNDELCTCPDGDECPSQWRDMDRSLLHHFRGDRHEMYMKLDFCRLNLPDRVCYKDEVVVTLKGMGFIMTDVHSPFRCKCKRVLYENRSWSENMLTYIEYSCGKPRCHLISNHVDSVRMPCMRIHNTGSSDSIIPDYRYQYFCRCRHWQVCKPDEFQAFSGEETTVYCKPKPRRRPPRMFRRRTWQ